MNNIDSIVFFHNNVNGDCYITRFLVDHIIKYTNSQIDKNKYYYYAPRSIISHCEDIGIPQQNFNITPFYSDEIITIIENKVYIHIWIGVFLNKINFCCFCLKNFRDCFNVVINELNTKCMFQIPFIETQNVYLPFKYNFYDFSVLQKFVENVDTKYKKKILVYNVNPTTFITINTSIHDHYLSTLANKYSDYLFITFCESNIKNENIISISTIYSNSSAILNTGYGVNFSYLSLCCDKIIGIPSGVLQFSFNNENINIKNKFMMFFDNTPNGNPGGCPVCPVSENSQMLCCEKHDIFVSVCLWNYDYNFTTDFVDNFICL